MAYVSTASCGDNPILHFMDKVEYREKKVCSPIEDMLISLTFSGMSSGLILIATNSKPNFGGNNSLEDYLIAAVPVASNLAVNVYRMIEQRMRPQEYDPNPSCGST